MTTEENAVAPEVQPTEATSGDNSTIKIIYVLYLSSIIFGITGLIGVIMAYFNKGSDMQPWENSHFRFQIRTFWIGLLYAFIGFLTTVVLIGFLILLFWLVWFIIRCAKGLKAAGRREPIANEKTWLW